MNILRYTGSRQMRKGGIQMFYAFVEIGYFSAVKSESVGFSNGSHAIVDAVNRDKSAYFSVCVSAPKSRP